MINGTTETLTEISWFTIGEALAMGKNMYSEVWDNTGPLAAGIYWLVDLIFGKSQLTYQILAILFVMHQAYIFNVNMLRNEVYNQKTYLPAMLYCVFMSLSFDFFTLSPPLIALSFLLSALRIVIRLDNRSLDKEVFNIGFYSGIAALIYIPSILFLGMFLFSLAVFRISSIRKLFISVYGFFFVIAIYLLYAFFNDSLQGFLEMYVYTYFTFPTHEYFSYGDLLQIGIIPAVLLILTILRTLTDFRFVNFQVSCQQILIIWAITATLNLFFTDQLTPYQLILFVPPLSFFVGHYLLLQKKKFFRELSFTIMLVATIGGMYVHYYQFIPKLRKLDYSQYFSKGASVQNKRILVLGEHMDDYQGNTLATRYFHWNISEKHFNKLNNYAIISDIYEELKAHEPEVILDHKNMAPKLFKLIPELGNRYERDKTYPNQYHLIK
ncbi:hypothetical protein GCM10023331_18960 [Algivirga pacifica]|uniref:Glycosyltransferase RgtA/B/C/D-like domain-containing protein n=2 Tax=Algivirga pacifica TaxID=1162670 RepID=A0ABP9DDV3_9BACT